MLSSLFWFQAIANACKVPATSVSELSESDVSHEYEKQFNEDQELEQLINGQICFKIYSFSRGMVQPLSRINLNTITVNFKFLVDNSLSFVSDKPAERKIILPGSFNPLHVGHLKLMEIATRYINSCYLLKIFKFFEYVVI